MVLPWKTKGICLGVPRADEVGIFKDFVKKILVPGGCNLIIMLVRYRYKFKSHPECAEVDSIDAATVEELLSVCNGNGIKLIPKMNLLGHQSFKGEMEALLKAHPELDETPDVKTEFYCKSLCPRHPDSEKIIFDLMDELFDVFKADGIHIGCDEVFDLGKCPRCRNTPTYQLFAEWINKLAKHNKNNKIQTYMWGDRLLNSVESGYGGWEASGNFTEPALEFIDKDIIICDWHYEDMTGRNDGKYPSVQIFSDAGFNILLCPYKNTENAKNFINFGVENDTGKISGILATTWCAPGEFMKYMLNNADCAAGDDRFSDLAATIRCIF